MLCTQPGRSSSHASASRHAPRLGVALVLLSVAFCFPASADVIHLESGGTLIGEITAETETTYQVRTLVGLVTVRKTEIVRIEPGPSPFAEYDRRAADAPPTASAQFELAEWCAASNLPAERRRHLLRALEIDPDFAPARRALGFVRVGPLWVDGRPAAERLARQRPADTEPQTAEQLAAAARLHWLQRIRAVQTTQLESRLPRLVAEGRARIAEITDPLAVAPLSEVLSRGGRASRETLVDALARFDSPEATLNLAVIALVERDESIRARVVAQLVQRADPAVPAQLRRALASDNDALIRRAAETLGALRAGEAIPDLIDVLTVQRRKRVEVPVQRYFRELPDAFNRPQQLVFGSGQTYRPLIGVAAAGDFFYVETETQVRNVTVFRTEVLEALKAITGVNFGFEEAEWRRWYEEQRS